MEAQGKYSDLSKHSSSQVFFKSEESNENKTDENLKNVNAEDESEAKAISDEMKAKEEV